MHTPFNEMQFLEAASEVINAMCTHSNVLLLSSVLRSIDHENNNTLASDSVAQTLHPLALEYAKKLSSQATGADTDWPLYVADAFFLDSQLAKAGGLLKGDGPDFYVLDGGHNDAATMIRFQLPLAKAFEQVFDPYLNACAAVISDHLHLTAPARVFEITRCIPSGDREMPPELSARLQADKSFYPPLKSWLPHAIQMEKENTGLAFEIPLPERKLN